MAYNNADFDSIVAVVESKRVAAFKPGDPERYAPHRKMQLKARVCTRTPSPCLTLCVRVL